MESAMYREDQDDGGSFPHRPFEGDVTASGAEIVAPTAVTKFVPPKPTIDAARRGASRRRLALVTAALLVATAAGGWYGAQWWANGRFVVSTDDAYVRAHTTTLAAKVSGYVVSIPIGDNAFVRAGDVIATIDDGDYRLAVEAARDRVATQQATLDRLGRQI